MSIEDDVRRTLAGTEPDVSATSAAWEEIERRGVARRTRTDRLRQASFVAATAVLLVVGAIVIAHRPSVDRVGDAPTTATTPTTTLINGVPLQEPTYLPAGFQLLSSQDSRGDTMPNVRRIYSAPEPGLDANGQPQSAFVRVVQGGADTVAASGVIEQTSVHGQLAEFFQPVGARNPGEVFLTWSEDDRSSISLASGAPRGGVAALTKDELHRIAEGLHVPNTPAPTLTNLDSACPGGAIAERSATPPEQGARPATAALAVRQFAVQPAINLSPDGLELGTPPDEFSRIGPTIAPPSTTAPSATPGTLAPNDPSRIVTIAWYLHRTGGRVDLAIRANQTAGSYDQGTHVPGGWFADYVVGCKTAVTNTGTSPSSPGGTDQIERTLFTRTSKDGVTVTAREGMVTDLSSCGQGCEHPKGHGVNFDYQIDGHTYRATVLDSILTNSSAPGLQEVTTRGQDVEVHPDGTVSPIVATPAADLVVFHTTGSVASVRVRELLPHPPDYRGPPDYDQMSPVDGWVAFPTVDYKRLQPPAEALDGQGAVVASQPLLYRCC